MGVEKMSGIYIPGAKVPDGDYVRVLMLHKDGTCVDGIGNVFKVIPVPPHGRLIDADALKQNTYEIYDPMGIIDAVPVDVIDNAPTVIEAEVGE